MTTTRILFGTMMAACVIGVLSTAVSAAVYSDNFESDTVGPTAPVGWTSSNTSKTSGLTLSTAVDSTTSSQVMDANQTAGTTSGAVFASSPLSSAVTLNDGDSVSLSFDLHLASTPTAEDRKFRFGLYNSATTGTNPEGYIARLDTGADVASSTADVWASVGGLGSTTAQGSASLATSSNAGFQLSSTTAIYNLMLTLTRVGNNLSDTLSLATNGGTPIVLTGLDASSGGNPASPVLAATGLSFNEILIGQNGGAPLDYHIDNVNVAFTAATPEPASLGLLGMGAVGPADPARRRKA